ncbi:TlpA disulfide reductase family protein [Chitinophaga eiseniae]|uniref:AhpC/TSA family protein n=1 Tax=Chitinophaga eiseniae TaxID=634771 RepID=A0A847SE94_9BACT|nr:TlpA disulfide reductase family protein [Chitinophaga eiseniae]NLR80131.1 AhpC/TSA family protein [Chitinophaga eiseniae]
MKKMMLSVLSVLTILVVQAQQPFVIKGKLSAVKKDAIVILSYTSDKKGVSDTAIVKDGAFILKGKIDYPCQAFIELKSLQNGEKGANLGDMQMFYLDKGTTRVSGTDKIGTALIKGGKAQADYLALVDFKKPYLDQIKALNEERKKLAAEKNEAGVEEVASRQDTIRLKMNKAEEGFVRKHPDAWVSLDQLCMWAGPQLDLPTFEPLFMGLSKELRHSEKGKILADMIHVAKKTGIGQPAVLFTQNNTEGKPFSLASLKGKYVLIDFWASWCVPCRAENPNVVKAYNKFKGKNFEIVGVSLDEKKEAWLKAIEKDGLLWTQVSDLKGWKNAVAVEYGVGAVPQNFLIDPNGIIIAQNLRGEALEKKLSELFPNQ